MTQVAEIELVPLAGLVSACAEDRAILPGFLALHDDHDWVTVTAILERTAVIEFAPEERTVAAFHRLQVDPAAVTIGSREPRPGYEGYRKPATARPATEPRFYNRSLDRGDWW